MGDIGYRRNRGRIVTILVDPIAGSRMAIVPGIKLLDRARELTEYFSPKVIGEVNDVYIKIARIGNLL